jgi:photosystem II stability/assembly factor-like uncharacterized protein
VNRALLLLGLFALGVTACGSGRAQQVSAQPSAERIGTAIDFLTPALGFRATRDGALARTRDGGETWHVLWHGMRFTSLRFLTKRRGFALSERGRLLATRDGARSWVVLRSSVEAFAFADARHGWAAGGSRLFRTTDGGRAWTRISSPCSRFTLYIGGLSFPKPRSGFVVCGGQPATIMQAKEVYATSDGGANWRLRACVRFVRRTGCPGRIDANGHVSGVDFRDAQVGLLLTNRGGIARTTDRGRRWTTTLFTDDEETVMATSWASSTTVFAQLYHRAKLLRSDDAGRHWHPV